ncbi:SsgA family sporulation/cell division regulator [Streptomyces sp. cmx-4-9]|uniref:SsgA family sporulation/cell division regulator n=1 Tax=Streptomyces sp. cmx-4-9 TaxID=2790941 RepID=UPI003980AB4C
MLLSRVAALIAVRFEEPAGDGMPLHARLSYEREDPFAVRAKFLAGHEVIATWCFDRQMLAEGLHRPVGEGDVTFRPQWSAGGEAVRVELRDGGGCGAGAVLFVDAQALERFLDMTYAVIPAGAESVDVDAFLEELLAR